MPRTPRPALPLILLLAVTAFCQAGQPRIETFADPAAAEADPDFAFQGEYAGEIQTDDGARKAGVQVVALGDGRFSAVFYRGGLPGDGWDGQTRRRGEGRRDNGTVLFTGDEGSGLIDGGVLTLSDEKGNAVGKLDRVQRESPTLAQEPPEGAVILFDGSTADSFEGGRLTEDALLIQGVTSKEAFGDCTLHLEFRTPYMPAARGQARGNSGCYLQGRYEVQILDSFGLEGKDNECGGLYSIRAPDANMCFPPLAWQTYDIDYTAARYDDAGKKIANALISVRHNGVPIHDQVELPNATTAAPVNEGADKGPLFLQDHGNPVRFRNIWLVEQ